MIILPVEKRFDWRNPPYVLVLLVILNVLIYFLYQTGDDARLEKAVQQYIQYEYVELEWPLYQRFLKQQSQDEQLEELTELYRLYEDEGHRDVAYVLLSDKAFYPYLLTQLDKLFDDRAYDYAWRERRASLDEAAQSLSYLRFGLIPSDVTWYGVITHQFMHGSVMHLLGNMVFLIICGFAVEAAIGHGLFIALYLLSGVVGAALFAFIDQGDVPLVGASGAISGVMAMYLWVFGLKRIQFFYWFYFLVGYIRLPALCILPLYIGREIYAFYFDTGSNVAFMAHAGGFIAASLAMALLWYFRPEALNQEYIEEDQQIDPYQLKLAEIYQAIEGLQFKTVNRLVEALIETEGERFELLLLQYNALKTYDAEHAQRLALKLLSYGKPTTQELVLQKQIWQENPSSAGQLKPEQLLKLGMRFVAVESIHLADAIFQMLDMTQVREHDVGIFARKLSVFYERSNDIAKARNYSEIADKHLLSAV